MKWLGAGAALVAAASALAQGPVAPEELFERLAPSVWTVHAFDASGKRIAGGSGVVVGPGSVVTNCHVLAKASRVTVGRENVSYGASLEHPDAERDLCLLKVANFTAPAVTVAAADGMKIGSRVYAIGSPRGLEQTISDGLLSGLRRLSDGSVHLQVTVPISPGSSGGGLFDAQGRLIGITTFLLRDSQNLNFAVPATWIAEVPQRARAALAGAEPAARTGSPSTTAGATQGTAPAAGRTFEYRLTDRLTRTTRTVSYRVDRLDGERIIFNAGAVVQTRSGEVVHVGEAAGGEADAAMPPGGWVPPGAAVGSRWTSTYRNRLTQPAISMELRAHVTGEEVLDVAGQRLRTLRVGYDGYSQRYFDSPCGGPYRATAWYAPDLGRLVRFEAQTQGCSMASRFVVDEQLELVAIY